MTSHITEADIDLLLDRDTAEHVHAPLRAHLDTCAECRSRWADVLSAHELLTNRRIDVPPTLVSRLTIAPPSRKAREQRRWTPLLRYAAVAVLAAGLAVTAERMRGKRTVLPPPDAARVSYLFVFSGTRAASLAAEERTAIARSFRTWTDSLSRLGQLVAMGQLTRDAPRLISATEPNLDSATVRAFGSMEGFYVLNARDDDDALALARSCPYLRFGGTIVVRRRAGAASPVTTVSLAPN